MAGPGFIAWVADSLGLSTPEPLPLVLWSTPNQPEPAFRTLGVGATAYVRTTDDPRVVRKGYQVWEGDRLSLNREDEYYTSGEEDMRREVCVFEVLGEHPQILKFLSVEQVRPGVSSLRLERARFGDIREYIRQYPDSQPPPKIRLGMACDAARGVAHMHAKGVQHCDISCRNLLLFEGFRVKLGDFGASLIDGRGFKHTHCEEASYELPLRGREFDARPGRQRELFALGSAIYEITTWERPWQGVGYDDIESMYAKEEFPSLEGNPAGLVIARCWKEEYGTADEVVADLEHCLEMEGKLTPWFLIYWMKSYLPESPLK